MRFAAPLVAWGILSASFGTAYGADAPAYRYALSAHGVKKRDQNPPIDMPPESD